MSSKKGFTLVELIAVIIILGILISFSVVSVSDYINSAKETTYNSYVKTMEESAKNYIIECISSNKCYDEIPNIGDVNTIEYEELVSMGYAEKLNDPANEGLYCTGYVKVKNNSNNDYDVSKLTYKACLRCNGKVRGGECE